MSPLDQPIHEPVPHATRPTNANDELRVLPPSHLDVVLASAPPTGIGRVGVAAIGFHQSRKLVVDVVDETLF